MLYRMALASALLGMLVGCSKAVLPPLEPLNTELCSAISITAHGVESTLETERIIELIAEPTELVVFHGQCTAKEFDFWSIPFTPGIDLPNGSPLWKKGGWGRHDGSLKRIKRKEGEDWRSYAAVIQARKRKQGGDEIETALSRIIIAEVSNKGETIDVCGGIYAPEERGMYDLVLCLQEVIYKDESAASMYTFMHPEEAVPIFRWRLKVE